MNSPRFSRRRPFFVALVAIAGLLALFIAPLRADTSALSFTGGAVSRQDGAITVGWNSLNGPVSLTQLGVWDEVGTGFPGATNPGLLTSHKVTVWDSIGAVVAQLVVPAGVGTSLVDGFRYAMLSMPVLLPTGSYTIGALFNFDSNDGFVSGAATLSTASGIGYGGSRLAFGDASPTAVGQPNAYFGPNFQFTTAGTGVPESGGTLWFLGASVIVLCALHRRAHHVSRTSQRDVPTG